jgi:hypothetical protein
MKKGKIIGIHDFEGHMTFTFVKDQSFHIGFERFLRDWDIGCENLFGNVEIASIIDRIYHFASDSFTLYVFFGKEKILVVLTAYSRKVLLETKKDILQFFVFDSRLLDSV